MKAILSTLVLIYVYNTIIAGDITLEGVYYGKNLYVINSKTSNPESFCVKSVTVNGKLSNAGTLESSSIEIDFRAAGLNPGDKVSVQISHIDGCRPVVLNPEVLTSTPACEYTYTKADKTTLNWNTLGENGPLPFVIETFKWDRWVVLGTVMGKGLPDSSQYKFMVSHLNGVNKYRIKQSDTEGRSKYSPVFEAKSANPLISQAMTKGGTIIFSNETQYEIYDRAGKLYLEGLSMEADISVLPKGEYILAWDNLTEVFHKK
jgi:hypothetical protein